jgi:glutamate synthase domain-containing protein 2
VIECGDAREVHHMALLLGYGAGAINPYLAFETIEDMIDQGVITGSPAQAVKNYVKASTKGVLKVMSKMGISTVASYTGARCSRPSACRGARRRVLHRHHVGSAASASTCSPRRSRAATVRLPRAARGGRPPRPVGGGEYQWRREGEHHLFNPETVFKLQHATRTKRYDIFKEYTPASTSSRRTWPRCAAVRSCAVEARPPVRSTKVEPVSAIVKRSRPGA